MVHEYIIAGSRTDESIALVIVEPLHCALFFHVSTYLIGLLLELLRDQPKNTGHSKSAEEHTRSGSGWLFTFAHPCNSSILRRVGIYLRENISLVRGGIILHYGPFPGFSSIGQCQGKAARGLADLVLVEIDHYCLRSGDIISFVWDEEKGSFCDSVVTPFAIKSWKLRQHGALLCASVAVKSWINDLSLFSQAGRRRFDPGLPLQKNQ
jgi:hypothetical protein